MSEVCRSVPGDAEAQVQHAAERLGPVATGTAVTAAESRVAARRASSAARRIGRQVLPDPASQELEDASAAELLSDSPFYKEIIPARYLPPVDPPPPDKAIPFVLNGPRRITLNGVTLPELRGDQLCLVSALLLRRNKPTPLSDLLELGFTESPTPNGTALRARRAVKALCKLFDEAMPGSTKAILESGRNSSRKLQLSPLLVVDDARDYAISDPFEALHASGLLAERQHGQSLEDIMAAAGRSKKNVRAHITPAQWEMGHKGPNGAWIFPDEVATAIVADCAHGKWPISMQRGQPSQDGKSLRDIMAAAGRSKRVVRAHITPTQWEAAHKGPNGAWIFPDEVATAIVTGWRDRRRDKVRAPAKTRALPQDPLLPGGRRASEVYAGMSFYKEILRATDIPPVDAPPPEQAIVIRVVSPTHVEINGTVLELKGHKLYMFNALLAHRSEPVSTLTLLRYGFRQKESLTIPTQVPLKAVRRLNQLFAAAFPDGTKAILEFRKGGRFKLRLSPFVVIEDVRDSMPFAPPKGLSATLAGRVVRSRTARTAAASRHSVPHEELDMLREGMVPLVDIVQRLPGNSLFRKMRVTEAVRVLEESEVDVFSLRPNGVGRGTWCVYEETTEQVLQDAIDAMSARIKIRGRSLTNPPMYTTEQAVAQLSSEHRIVMTVEDFRRVATAAMQAGIIKRTRDAKGNAKYSPYAIKTIGNWHQSGKLPWDR